MTAMIRSKAQRSKRFLFINGSPRGVHGNTHAVAAQVAAGVRAAGGRAEIVTLAEKQISPCTGCFDCWNDAVGRCPIDDDMPALLGRLRTADVLVLATPVYLENITGMLKVFLDRTLPLLDPFFERDGHGGYRHRKRLEHMPELAIIATCGLPDMKQFEVLQLFFHRLANHWQTTLIGEIYRTEAELLLSGSFVLKPFVTPYFKLLKQAGIELASDGHLTGKTRLSLERSLVPAGLYTAGANTYWDKLREGDST
jgi:multimeric flavodoxin WrbA